MIGWIILFIYLSGILLTWPSFAKAIYENDGPHYDEMGDKLFASGIGLLAAFTWPISFGVLWMARRL